MKTNGGALHLMNVTRHPRVSVEAFTFVAPHMQCLLMLVSDSRRHCLQAVQSSDRLQFGDGKSEGNQRSQENSEHTFLMSEQLLVHIIRRLALRHLVQK